MYAQIFVMLWFLIVASIVAYWAIFRTWHPFWSSRPGPHFHHLISRKMGIFNDYIIRIEPAEIPSETRWEIPRECTRKKLPDYVKLLNENYAIGTDYTHTYTPEILEKILFASGVMAYEVREANECVGMIASVPLKSTKTGQLANLLKTAPSHTTIGLIDFLCVAESVRGMKLAEHLIAWIDTYASRIGRRVHVFEREGRTAPIPYVTKTEYYYCVCKNVKKTISKNQVIALENILHSEWDLVNQNDIVRWESEDDSSFIYHEDGIGTIIVEDAHMMDKDGKSFGIVLAFLPIEGKAVELFSHVTSWSYVLAPGNIVEMLPSYEWNPSSVAFTHLYNCVTNTYNLQILTS